MKFLGLNWLGQASRRNLPPAGIDGIVWLSTITSSYLVFAPLTHCPPTSGVLDTLRIGPAPPNFTGPTMVLRSVAATASRIAALLLTSLVRLSTSTATSSTPWEKPIGWVHCFFVLAS